MSDQQSPDKDKKSALDEWLKRKKKATQQKGIEPLPQGQPALLSHGQERLWLLDQLYPEQALYNYAHKYQLKGTFKPEHFVSAFQKLAQRHQIILSNYEVNGDDTVQRVAHKEIPISYQDLSHLAPEAQQAELDKQESLQITQSFDLSQDPLLRLYIFKRGEQYFEILVILHHIIGDAWSMGIINRELSEIYQSLTQGRVPALTPLKIQYQDFAYWQRQQPLKEADLTYWKEQLSGELPTLNLPKITQAKDSGFTGGVYKKKLTAELRQQLNELAKKHETTMYVLMLTAYKILLSRYSHQADIVVGSPFSNRDRPELENIIGFFNETLVLRTEVDSALSLGGILARVKQTTMDALSHKNVPFDTLVNEISPARKTGENPLFQTMFLYNSIPQKLDLGPGMVVEEEMLDLDVSKFELTLFVNDLEHGLELVFEHDHSIELWVVEAMAAHFEALVVELIQKPDTPVSRLSVYSAEMLEGLSLKWQGTSTDLPASRSIHELILRHVSVQPEASAVVFGDTKLSYQQLGRWSDQIARKLTGKGVGKNDFVGLFMPRSLEMIVAILGILKAGAAYLPLDPDYPEERLDFMLSDTAAKVLLYHPTLESQITSDDIEAISVVYDLEWKSENPLEFSDQLDDFAYVIYTSGSTGKPKGVPVTHRNLIHSTTARFEFFEDPMQSFLLLSSFSFDSSIAGIFWSLCAGVTLVLPPKRIEQDIESLSEIIAREKVTHTLMLPSLYQVLLSFSEHEKLTSLKAVIVAGEACSQGLKSDHFSMLPDTRLYNEYGPTEASVWCIAHEITPEDETIPIGRPIQNSSAYILDPHLQPVPAGAEGELYIGGLGVTKGYLNREELTRDRFLENPFGTKGDKIYRTGDLARFGPDGVIAFLGRADQQVKIRGFRVEPEEIRNVILNESTVSEAIVKVLEDEGGNKQLVAWVQSHQPDLEPLLRKSLKATLPDYMVPSAITITEALPKLPNGKIDHKQLTAPKTHLPAGQTYTAPSSQKEEVLVKLWQDILKVEKVGIDDNFFDIGGDSILSIQIVAKARQAGLKIGPTDIFNHQKIRSLADSVSFLEEENQITEVQENYPIQFPLSYQQQAFLLHSLQSPKDQGLLQLEFNIKGRVNPEFMKKAWEQVAREHSIMRTSFHWEETDTPYQVIHEEASIIWTYLDFSNRDEPNISPSINDFMTNDHGQELDLQQPGGGRITLLRVADNDFILCWTCHHLLVDGWSGAIVFKDALAIYEGLVRSQKLQLVRIPNYKQFLDWKASQDETAASQFWQSMLKNSTAPLFSDQASKSVSQQGFQDITLHPEASTISTLQNKIQQERLTLNTVLQGLWMLTLGSYFGEHQVSTGLTVTGRACDFDGIDRITGLLMNVLPFQKTIAPGQSLISWLHELQVSLNELRSFEHTDPDQIQGWTKNASRPFFDNLFVFGNFMSEKLHLAELEVAAFKGDFSATFPLTIRVNPGAVFEINCRYDSSVVSEKSAQWLMRAYRGMLAKLTEGDTFTQDLQSMLAEKPVHLFEKEITSVSDEAATVNAFSGTQNGTQLSLVKLWEKVIGTRLIGIHDNYFELGGTSLGAIRLFSEIEKHFGKKLSPTLLISKPTIAQLAEVLSEDKNEEVWSSIIPMKTSGELPPLFCIHSGGAHVLFYQGLAKHISADRPVYAIQPTGIDGEEEHHGSIREMANDYIREMKKVQPQGPYHLIGTCFGNAVGVEMSHQLQKMGEELAVFYVVDSAPAYLEPPSPNGERKPVSRMFKMVQEGNWKGIIRKFKNRYIRLDKRLKAKSRSEQEIELDEIIDSLNDLYVTYKWKPIEDRVVLIRSTEFSQRKDKGFHLKRWQFLALNRLEVFEVDGHHLTLFDEPEVEGLTKTIDRHLSQLAMTKA